MSLFSTKPKPEKLQKSEESASSVRKAFEARIDEFLDEVDAPSNLLGKRDKTLDGVFSWGRKVWHDKRKADRQLDQYVQAYKSSQNQIEELKKRLERTHAQLREREGQLEHADATIQQMGMEKRRTQERYDKEKKGMQDKYEDVITRMMMDHTQTVKNMEDHHRHIELTSQNKFEMEVAQLTSKCDEKVEQMRSHYHGQEERLVGQLLTSQNDNEGWPDDKLKYKFNELRQLIDSTTSPRNEEFLIPGGRVLGPNLDPTNFIGRIGGGRSHYVLKGAIWRVLYEQFFSTPFGFGIFGPGKAVSELMKVYFTWRELFGMNNHAATNDDIFALLRKDRMANTWRSATFQTINETLTSNHGAMSHSQSPIAQFSAENTQVAVDRICAIFLEVLKLSNSGLRRDVEDQIHQMVDVSSQLAIQFGVHPAQLQLFLPRVGEKVEIGEDCHDCEDGDYSKGTVYSVDLVVVPGLRKVGDGRSDMTSKRSIVPCEIYPADS